MTSHANALWAQFVAEGRLALSMGQQISALRAIANTAGGPLSVKAVASEPAETRLTKLLLTLIAKVS